MDERGRCGVKHRYSEKTGLRILAVLEWPLPEEAIDEKPHIQALERTQGYLKVPETICA